MKEKTIWLNHWFSAAYNVINLIRKDEIYNFKIIGSSEKEFSVLQDICDEWYSEPIDCSDKEYRDFCLDFCKEHQVDIFMPHRNMMLISKYKSEFESRGIKVMVDDYDSVLLLNNKNRAYDFFKGKGIVEVPDYYVVENIPDFIEAYKKIENKYGHACIKFVRDEGGKSYRLIDNNRKGYYSLFKKQNTRMTLDAILDALSEKETFSPLMVMPFLSGAEISIDCLNTNSGLIMVPRIKVDTRFETIKYDELILAKCRKVLDEFHLECPCNVQFKYLGNVPYFLEVNTRMSGGVQMSCLASGVNIPDIAVNKLLGRDVPWTMDRSEHIVSQVEIPVLLK